MKNIHIIIPVVVVGIIAFSPPVMAAQEGNPEHGQTVYLEFCLQCHGGHGEGWGWGKKIPPPPVPIPDLSDPGRMTQLSDQYLFDIIKGGGEAVGKTRFMPPAGRVLSDEDIRDVVAYLRFLTQGAHGSMEKER